MVYHYVVQVSGLGYMRLLDIQSHLLGCHSMNTKDLRYFHKATVAAGKSLCRYRVGCTIVSGKDHLSTFNARKTHPMLLNDRNRVRDNVHAEMRALVKAQFSTVGSTAYVARIDKHGGLLPSKPCPICSQLFKDAGVSYVVCLSQDGTVVRMKVNEL